MFQLQSANVLKIKHLNYSDLFAVALVHLWQIELFGQTLERLRPVYGGSHSSLGASGKNQWTRCRPPKITFSGES